MADDGGQPAQDIGAQNFARGIGGGAGAGPQDNNKPAANMQEFIDQLFEQVTNWFSKGTGIRWNSFMNVGMFGGTKLEDGGIKTGNSIMSASVAQGTTGGVLANAASVFKWWDGQSPSATPIEAASGGDAGSWGGGSGGGDGGGGGGGGNAFESYVAAHPDMGEMFIAAGGGNRFKFDDVPWEGLGNFSPPTTGVGMGHSESLGMA